MNEPATDFTSLLHTLGAQFAARAESPAPEALVTPAQWAYRMAAAVQAVVELPALKPWPASLTDSSGGFIIDDDVVPAPGATSAAQVMLRTEIRHEALARFGSRDDMLQAMRVNAPPAQYEALQQLYAAWIAGTNEPLDDQPYGQLIQSAQILEWLRPVVGDLPRADDVRRLIGRRSVYSLFEHLVDASFTDRERELETLRTFMSVDDARPGSLAIAAQLKSWLKLKWAPPLVITGVGGVGKSALLGKCLVDQLEAEPALQFPFVYLAFDNPSLRVGDPLAIVTEMRRQLTLLYPDRDEAIEASSSRIAEYRRRRDVFEQRTFPSSREARAEGLESTNRALYASFAELVSTLVWREGVNAPFVIVLDTFEEAQFLGAQRLRPLMELLEVLRELCPTLRIIVSSRARITGEFATGVFSRVQELRLTELPQPLAIELLLRLGVADRETAALVAKQVRGNPLNLRLAARLMREETASPAGVQGLRTRGWLLSLSDEVIRGQLYARILDHIHDERVRALAHPGMVLRKVTAPVIARVLAPACGVAVKDDLEAEGLLFQLSREHALVAAGPEGSLVYREDVRKPTLALLQRDRPADVRRIHEAAAAFYADRSDPEERTEELYHLLALEALDHAGASWDQSAGRALASVIDELPAGSQTWLASRLGLDLPEEIRRKASLDDWERLTGRKVRDFLRNRNAEGALQLLAERGDRSGASPLFGLEAKAYVALHRPDDAIATLHAGIENVSQSPNRGRLAELLWLLAQTYETEGRLREADGALSRGETVAAQVRNPACLLQMLVQRMLLRQEGSPLAESADRAAVLGRLTVALRRMTPLSVRTESSLSRLAATIVGPDARQEFISTLRIAGIGPMEPEVVREFVSGLARAWDKHPTRGIELGRVVGNMNEGGLDLEEIIDYLLTREQLYDLALPAIHDLLRSRPMSLSGANLAGIEEYREAWELETSPEAA